MRSNSALWRSRQTHGLPGPAAPSRSRSTRGSEYKSENVYYDKLVHLQRVLYELNSAVAPAERRLHALDEALREFDHHDESRHDEEIKCSADMILFQKLALALAIDSSSEEVPLICAALVMVYRASRVAVATSFDEIGMAVLPLIMAIIKRPQYSITQQEELPIN